MKRLILIPVSFLVFTVSSCGQNSATQPVTKSKTDLKVGGNCEGCEAIYETPIPFEQLNEVDSLPGFTDAGPKIEISGIIYKADGKTPAPGIILYVYHTDQKGIYATKGDEKGCAKRHGYMRGWVKTNEKGE